MLKLLRQTCISRKYLQSSFLQQNHHQRMLITTGHRHHEEQMHTEMIPESDIHQQLNDDNQKDIKFYEQTVLDQPDYFQVSRMFTLQDLFHSRVHLGHKAGCSDPNYKYVFGNRFQQQIIDLDQTVEHLQLALNVTAHVAFRKGIILFICRSAQFSHIVETMAQECGEFAHTRRWRLGTFTNSLLELGGDVRLPDLIIFINMLDTINEPHVLVRHAAKMLIPTIAIADTNCDPNQITYPIPGNDDTPCAIKLYCRLFKEAILKGKSERLRIEDLVKDSSTE